MSYIVMGRDECGDEFRPSSKYWKTEGEAVKEMTKIEDEYVEARGFWVEEYRDRQWYAERWSDRYDNDTIDLY